LSEDAHSNLEFQPCFHTKPDNYGVYREYSFRKPSITPDFHLPLLEVSDSPYLALNTSTQFTSTLSPSVTKLHDDEECVINWFAPFTNPSTHRLMNWYTTTSVTKSMTELDSLVREVLLAPDFKVEELAGFRAAKENARLDSFKFKQGPSTVSDKEDTVFDDTWIKGTIHIPLPCDGVCQSEDDAPLFPIVFYYRKIVDVFKAAVSELESKGFHIFPFKAYWHPSKGEPPERIYSEIYTANCWNDEYNKINESREGGPNHNLEAFIIGLMFWSDSTVLAQFGTASLWPIYLYIGNQSKYPRAKPSSMAAHHLAYLPKVCCCTILVLVANVSQLGDDIQEFYFKEFGKHATAGVLTHIRREMAQAVWRFLLDDEFMHAYVHGIPVELVDGVERLGFPRFLTYSADYPEK
jgi:hypothetical protein